jgi:CheY-like chemotaxis protein
MADSFRLDSTAGQTRLSLPTPAEPSMDPVPRRILVVDDNRDVADMMGLLAQTWGHEARTAYDAGSALAVARRFQPDVVLLDVTLPDVDGLELARQIRSEPWGETALLVAVTGWGREGDRARSRDAGCDAHLVKPISFDTLRGLILQDARGPSQG